MKYLYIILSFTVLISCEESSKQLDKQTFENAEYSSAKGETPSLLISSAVELLEKKDLSSVEFEDFYSKTTLEHFPKEYGSNYISSIHRLLVQMQPNLVSEFDNEFIAKLIRHQYTVSFPSLEFVRILCEELSNRNSDEAKIILFQNVKTIEHIRNKHVEFVNNLEGGNNKISIDQNNLQKLKKYSNI